MKEVKINKEITADYYIPSEDGTGYEKVNFSTVADQVKENDNKTFIPKSLKTHLEEINGKEVLKQDITDELNITTSGKIASAKAVNKLANCLGEGTIKIIVSEIQPQPQAGVTILWINSSEEE